MIEVCNGIQACWSMGMLSHGCALHQAEPLGGGQLLGNGRLWVSPAGEMDPRAMKIHMEGRKLPTETLLKRYLPKVTLL